MLINFLISTKLSKGLLEDSICTKYYLLLSITDLKTFFMLIRCVVA